MNERINYHGVPVDNLSLTEALDRVSTMLVDTRAGQHIVTLTPSMYLEARRNPEFNNVLNQAALVVPESVALRVSSFLDRSVPKLIRVPGMTLVRGVLEKCQKEGYKVALLGSSEENRQLALTNMRRIYPGLQVATVESGYYDFGNDGSPAAIIDRLSKLQPDFAIMAACQVVAEGWIDHWIVGQNTGVGVIGNFGQAIDVLAGVRRDFATSRRLGLEWLLRLTLNTTNRREKLAVLLAFGKMALLDGLQATSG